MRTGYIRGTDIHGPEDWWSEPWVEKPITDGGRLKFDRADRESMDNEVYEMAGIAGIDTIAVGQRGRQDAGFPYQHIFADALREYHGPFSGPSKPTVMPFLDTGGAADVVSWQRSSRAFDFLNPEHRELWWLNFVKPFYDAHPNLTYERTADGRLLILVWSINPAIGAQPGGVGFVNQAHAQLVLDDTARAMVAAGLGEPAFIVDQSWLQFAPGLNVYGVHDWFNPPAGKNYSIRLHKGVSSDVSGLSEASSWNH